MKYFCSIIVPFRNSEKTILKCINSLINQIGNVKFEIILINDFSSDRSNSICKKAIVHKDFCAETFRSFVSLCQDYLIAKEYKY